MDDLDVMYEELQVFKAKVVALEYKLGRGEIPMTSSSTDGGVGHVKFHKMEGGIT
jgi:hypothetical protein